MNTHTHTQTRSNYHHNLFSSDFVKYRMEHVYPGGTGDSSYNSINPASVPGAPLVQRDIAHRFRYGLGTGEGTPVEHVFSHRTYSSTEPLSLFPLNNFRFHSENPFYTTLSGKRSDLNEYRCQTSHGRKLIKTCKFIQLKSGPSRLTRQNNF